MEKEITEKQTQIKELSDGLQESWNKINGTKAELAELVKKDKKNTRFRN